LSSTVSSRRDVRVYDLVREQESLDAEGRPVTIPAWVRHRLFVMRGEGKQQEYQQEGEDQPLSISRIPFEPCYGGIQEGFLDARPLLFDVARLNLSHWQASADLAHTTFLTAAPRFVVSGVPAGETIDMNPDSATMLSDPMAKGTWQGAPTAGGELTIRRLERLESAMKSLAPVAMTERRGAMVESAEAKRLDRAQSDSKLNLIVEGLENCLNRSLQAASEYWAEGEPISLTIPRDFLPEWIEPSELREIVSAHTAGKITTRVMVYTLMSKGLYEGLEEFDPEAEIEAIEAMGAAASFLLPPPGGPDGDEEGPGGQ